jgi:hypothetical protein
MEDYFLLIKLNAYGGSFMSSGNSKREHNWACFLQKRGRRCHPFFKAKDGSFFVRPSFLSNEPITGVANLSEPNQKGA